tara:strand:- start:178 stop:384 length:207 start_codon:yes stop_codon:yes gene_type:complete
MPANDIVPAATYAHCDSDSADPISTSLGGESMSNLASETIASMQLDLHRKDGEIELIADVAIADACDM